MTEDNIVAFIDIGSAKTKVLIAEIFPKINIVGNYVGRTQGMSKGEIIDIGILKESVHDAIREAEKNAGLSAVYHATLALSSSNVGGFKVTGLTSVKGNDGVVNQDDLLAAKNDAYKTKTKEGRTIVHRIRQPYLLDHTEMENPLGRRGNTLAYRMWLADADIKYLTEMIQIPNNYGMKVDDVFIASFASAAGATTGSEADKNRLVIDIGAGTTDYVLYRSGYAIKAGVIPVGGNHISNDISTGLQVSFDRAERLKISRGDAVLSPENLSNEVLLDGEEEESTPSGKFSSTVSKYTLDHIISLRTKETFGLIQHAIGDEDMKAVTAVHLTGGSSALKGIATVAMQSFGHNAFVVEPHAEFAPKFDSPDFSTVIGMAHLFYNQRKNRAREQAKHSLFSKFISFFKQ